MREVITRYGREGLGVFWFFLEPLLFTGVVTLMWYFLKLHSVTAFPIIAFAFTGFSVAQLWRNGANRAATALAPNLGLITHRNVMLLDIFMARIFLEWVGATGAFLLLAVGLTVTGAIALPEDVGDILVGWLLMAWFSLGLGLVVGALSAIFGVFEKLWRPMNYPLFMISGTFYMVDWLPASIRELALWVPMVHGNEMVRHGFFGSVVPTYENPSYLLVLNLAMTFLGLAMASYAQRRNLGQG
jgi:capsular polysaccharide transport system permease protein